MLKSSELGIEPASHGMVQTEAKKYLVGRIGDTGMWSVKRANRLRGKVSEQVTIWDLLQRSHDKIGTHRASSTFPWHSYVQFTCHTKLELRIGGAQYRQGTAFLCNSRLDL
jgi:hypothetical protein